MQRVLPYYWATNLRLTKPTECSHPDGFAARQKDATVADIAVVGGGPSGAMCGEQLARAGNKVTIYDEHLAWEKPCGGGLTHKAIECFPFLLDNSYPKKLVREIELISSEEHHAALQMTHPIVIYSRTVLNGMLLDRAREAGCEVRRSHVFNVDTVGSKATILRRRRMAGYGFSGAGGGSEKSIAARNSRAAARRTGDYAGILCAANRGVDHYKVFAAL